MQKSSTSPVSPAPLAHTWALGLALVVAAGVLGWGQVRARILEARFVHEMSPDFSDEKINGLALQREAFAQPDLMVFYGSSELVKEMPNNATQFFADSPTGFRVFAVGKQGAASLTTLQKAAAAGEALRGQKVAYSISPGWFFTETFDPKYYAGNFSVAQARELAWSAELSWGLKGAVADRMLAYPETVEGDWVLQFALERLSNGTALDRALYEVARPLGWLERTVAEFQDHAHTAATIEDEQRRLSSDTRPALRGINWPDLFRRAAQFVNQPAIAAKKTAAQKKRPAQLRDAAFRQTLDRANEWTDLHLLMRVFAELGAKPLLLSMPVDDARLEASGLSPESRDEFFTRLNRLADQHEAPLAEFREHERDPEFLVDLYDHLSGKGWLYYNKALDDFWHGRMSSL